MVRFTIGKFFLVPLVALLASRAFAADGGKPEKTEVVVTYAQPSGAFTPVWVAHEAGLFRKHGLNSKLQLLNPQVSAQAVISEQADFYTDGPDLINARLRGGQVKYFGGTMQQLVFQLWGARELKSVQDLRGKTVAASTPRAALDTATREALKKHGLVPDRDVQILYVQTVPAILSSVIGGKTQAGTLSAPNTLKARDAGLNLLVDIGKLNIPAFQVAYGTTEKYLKNHPNTVLAFLKAIAEGVAVSRKDPATAKKAIAKYAKIEEPKLVDGTYEAFAPYWALSLAVRPEAVQAQFEYLDEREFPNAKNADPKEFFDNSFVAQLERSGFLKSLGMTK
ncbi:MAG TPA: ABC transporter substrate-binding protein [candidate division Zixibacteria bacterium]|nr:ABC transporter substrate-binding protein [candidate division Zixibacteria bacterium]